MRRSISSLFFTKLKNLERLKTLKKETDSSNSSIQFKRFFYQNENNEAKKVIQEKSSLKKEIKRIEKCLQSA
jgi:hypothetical protein